MSGNVKENIARANAYAREEAIKGHCAIAPHCIFTQFLNDSIPEERDIGMKMGIALLLRCDALLVCGNIISEGMKVEIKIAYENGIDVSGTELSKEEIEEIVFEGN